MRVDWEKKKKGLAVIAWRVTDLSIVVSTLFKGVQGHVRENTSVDSSGKTTLKLLNVAKFEIDLLKTNGDKASQTREILKTL